jgi:hypothetical protein
MKADNSRDTHIHKKHYSRVIMQQGRVQVDADWNEQQAINQYRIETETRDVIGLCGAPMNNAGFKISVQANNTLLISQGRFYVDGILCENDADVAYEKQPYLPNVIPPDVLTLLQENKTLWAIVYLDVWQRHITALDDPHIREVALGGPDTSTRAQTVWQVNILPLPSDILQLQTKLAELNAELATAKQAPEPDVKKIVELTKEIDVISQEIAHFSSQVTCITKSKEWDDLTAPSTGTLNARTQPIENPDDPCLIPPQAGYQLLENQLYRVEIHYGSDNPNGPTFKWSRENGSVVTTIESFSGNDINVHDVGPDDVLGFAPGQWVEVIDDEKDLKGLPGELLLIKSVDSANRVITTETAPTVVDPSLNPKLRRWEQMGPSATPDDVQNGVTITNDWQDLEGGIQVLLSQGTYKTGDYWLIPARTATGDIEWPPYQLPNTNPIAQPPAGIQHHYCRLGILGLNPRNQQLFVQDCRELFPPLTSPAIHVTDINWSNDDLFSPQQISSEGLKITLDAVPEQLSVSSASVIVTLEMPASQVLGRVGYISLILNGVVTVEDNVIHWLLDQQASTGAEPDATLIANLPISFTSTTESAVGQVKPLLVRVLLKGHVIWSNQDDELYYLDGQAFGQPDMRTDGQTPRTALILPSGAGTRASDFESWFYLGEQPAPAPLRITTINFIPTKPGAPIVFTVDLSQVPPTSTTPPTLPTVLFGVADGVNAIEITFNRSVAPDGIAPHDQPQSIVVTQSSNLAPGSVGVNGDLEFKPDTNNTVVSFILPKLQSFIAGKYTLTVFGSDQANVGLAIRAQADRAALDGDFDGEPGGDFVLPFEVQ